MDNCTYYLLKQITVNCSLKSILKGRAGHEGGGWRRDQRTRFIQMYCEVACPWTTYKRIHQPHTR